MTPPVRGTNLMKEQAMAIEKKSLISTLKTTKKANLASNPASSDVLSKSSVKASPIRKLAAKKAAAKKVTAVKYKMDD
jgi:hypothetical protein